MASKEVSIIGRTNFHRADQPFGIRQPDRLSHTYVLGQTGADKSTLLKQLALQDAHAGRGFAVIDPHGDMIERVYASLGSAVRERTTYLNALDRAQPFGYNPLRRCDTGPSRFRARSALGAVVEELEKRGIAAATEQTQDGLGLRVPHGEAGEFIYSVHAVARSLTAFALADSGRKRDDRRARYYRAEVYLAEGGRGYDIYGYDAEQVIADVIAHYDQFRHFLSVRGAQ